MLCATTSTILLLHTLMVCATTQHHPLAAPLDAGAYMRHSNIRQHSSSCEITDTVAADCSDLSDVSSKASMQSAGWSFSFTYADGHAAVGPNCGNGANWYGWSGGNNVGTLTSPALHGSGTATVEFGNCWNAVSSVLYEGHQFDSFVAGKCQAVSE